MGNLELSILQEDCTGCGACPEVAPRHFFMGDDGLAYVKEDGAPDEIRQEGLSGKVAVSSELEAAVVEAAEDCPGECIYVEPARVPVEID